MLLLSTQLVAFTSLSRIVLEQWKPHFNAILDDLLNAERIEGVSGLCACSAKCPRCIMEDHCNQPFHWLDVWNGEYLEKHNLLTFGFIFHLGHHGKPCPHLSSSAAPANFIVTHTNGIHHTRIHWCHCPNAKPIMSQLFVFTIALLKQWDLHYLTSKKSAYDFVVALWCMTSNCASQKVKNRYREFNIIAHIWQHLMMVKRSEDHHGLMLLNYPAHSLTVPCFTYPWPSMNMPPDWQKTPAHLAYVSSISGYIHACELGGDGNHGLQKKHKCDDPNDVSLAPSQGYFVDAHKMKDYMEDIQSEPPPETCSSFKVGRAQHPGKFCNLEVSGVVAVICIHHGCFHPGAMVDLQKGE
ncbi:uncharacterized protein LAESUDRAFT_738039 [Laetiporus sulphureus 93-53]|uniref:CxC2-like cysteine cluster KDZ transposase-associated domain-containing protein n=1 Tax=Laetiporus sulphureus 93-53 TaxID=1314785 RepID=A0A165D3S7_9APHY|nr:uncharacterized protein LAESUDRAFT_738039 [Laetiporus sulphureus 93-53]KZT04100.1 hypothetical protein LAESUDRAFT_738039 [Laetiporus sulphureus 93-53]